MAAIDIVTESQLDSLTTTIASAVKANTTAFTGHDHPAADITFADAAGDYSATDVEAALAEVRVVADAAAGGGVAINDSVTTGTDAWSSTKIDSEIDTRIANLVDSAPGALDTLDELASALGDDANFATTMSTALANRLRFDAAQTLDSGEKTQALTNLGVARSTVDFAAAFTAAL